MKIKPKAGIVFTCIDGFDLDQDKLENYQKKFINILDRLDVENKNIDFIVTKNIVRLLRKNPKFFRKLCDKFIKLGNVFYLDLPGYSTFTIKPMLDTFEFKRIYEGWNISGYFTTKIENIKPFNPHRSPRSASI